MNLEQALQTLVSLDLEAVKRELSNSDEHEDILEMIQLAVYKLGRMKQIVELEELFEIEWSK